jgi:hypothetical protein
MNKNQFLKPAILVKNKILMVNNGKCFETIKKGLALFGSQALYNQIN